MAEPGDADLDSSAADRTSNTFMVAAIVFLFLVVVFVFFLYLYSTRRLRRLRRLRRTRILVFSASDLGASSSICRGIDPSVLRSLPVAVYRAAEFGNGIECAVCLCELADGEAVRILSKCGHGFHLECIDMWFHSHSTCPLCRSPVGAEPIPIPNSNPLAGSEALNPDSPVFQSNQPQTIEAPSSSSARLKKPKGDLAIEIPRREPERFSSPVSQLPTSRNARDETRTPGSGMLPAVRRRWSMGKRTPTPGSGSTCSPMGGDLEQGFGGFYGERSTPPAKSPANSRLETT